MNERKRKFDCNLRQLVDTPKVEAWFYNNPKAVEIIVRNREFETTVTLILRKSTLAKIARLP